MLIFPILLPNPTKTDLPDGYSRWRSEFICREILKCEERFRNFLSPGPKATD
jgi:hypothetical protein